MPPKKKTEKNDEDNKPAKVNYDELIRANISDISYSFDRQTFGYSKLMLSGKKLEKPIESLPSTFGNYRFLKNIDVSYNNVSDISTLSVLPNLVTLNAKRNNISSLKSFNREPADGEDVEHWKSLQWIDLTLNKVSELGPIRAPNLLHLDLSQNDIKKLEHFDGHPKLEFLDLSSNGITDTTSISKMPSLKSLFLSFNRIRNMNGFDGLDSLNKLSLRSNLVSTWEEAFPPIETLEYLNMRSCRIEKMEELEKLASLPKMKTLVISFNPFIEKNPTNYVYQIVTKFPSLQRLNKHKITRIIQGQTIQYQRQAWDEQKRHEEEERRREEEEANKENND